MFLIYAAAASAEELPALLHEGPVPHLGIEFLGVNAIPSYYGEYFYGERLIRVYFTKSDIFLTDDWSAFKCGAGEAYTLNGYPSGEDVYFYRDRRGWMLFLAFEKEADYVCRFIEIYASRQNYFINIARDDTAFSMPAVLELD